MCKFGLSGCRVKPLWGPRSFTRQPENSKRAGASTHHQNSTRSEERKKIVARGKKRENIFGKFRLRPVFFSSSANFDFGQFRLRPISTSANYSMLNFRTIKGGGPNLEQVGSRSLGTPSRWSPEQWGAEGWGGPKFRAFFSLPPQFSFFLLSLGGPFVEFWWCVFEGWGRSIVHVWALRLSCETPAALGPNVHI